MKESTTSHMIIILIVASIILNVIMIGELERKLELNKEQSLSPGWYVKLNINDIEKNSVKSIKPNVACYSSDITSCWVEKIWYEGR